MSKQAITIENISNRASALAAETRTARRKRLKSIVPTEAERRIASEHLRRQIERIREKIFLVACSAAWAEDCLYRGVEYVPNFRCHCALCRSKYPHRLYPGQARESRVSADCQVEVEEDPELAEDLAALRNERVRVGSVFIAGVGSDRSRRKRRRRKRNRKR
ncbi:MAG: hypothetical protein ABSF29_04425 [Tepidisphaeraceae bacterium]|jgi:hypothetical protein